jgi:hypothetical protein
VSQIVRAPKETPVLPRLGTTTRGDAGALIGPYVQHVGHELDDEERAHLIELGRSYLERAVA